jgi:hypothetical protein
MTIRIEARWYYALLEPTDDGIAVEIWKRAYGGVASRDSREVIDAPLHVVLDHVHDMLRGLPSPYMPRGSK